MVERSDTYGGKLRNADKYLVVKPEKKYTISDTHLYVVR
jgi:hypothetical protein